MPLRRKTQVPKQTARTRTVRAVPTKLARGLAACIPHALVGRSKQSAMGRSIQIVLPAQYLACPALLRPIRANERARPAPYWLVPTKGQQDFGLFSQPTLSNWTVGMTCSRAGRAKSSAMPLWSNSLVQKMYVSGLYASGSRALFIWVVGAGSRH